jgi:hypothetical protein
MFVRKITVAIHGLECSDQGTSSIWINPPRLPQFPSSRHERPAAGLMVRLRGWFRGADKALWFGAPSREKVSGWASEKHLSCEGSIEYDDLQESWLQNIICLNVGSEE